MKRRLSSILAVGAVVAVACGSGDKKPALPATSTPVVAATERAATPVPDALRESEPALGDVFATLFGSGALGGGIAAGDGSELAGYGPGDASLKQYLLTESDLPAGFAVQGAEAVRIPDGISKGGGGDVALSIASKGDFASGRPTGAVMLMSMAMKFDDVQALGSLLGDAQGLTDEQLRDQIDGAGGGLAGITDVHILDASALGDGGFGMTMALDLSGLLGAFAGADTADDIALKDAVINMKMYIFGRGDLAAAVLSMTFGAGATSGVDELALAHVVDSKLQSR